MAHDLNFSSEENHLLHDRIPHDRILIEHISQRSTESGSENEYAISTEGRFKLLDHEQLISARFWSLVALVISIVTLTVGTALQIIDNNHAIERQDQYNALFEKVLSEQVRINNNLNGFLEQTSMSGSRIAK